MKCLIANDVFNKFKYNPYFIYYLSFIDSAELTQLLSKEYLQDINHIKMKIKEYEFHEPVKKITYHLLHPKDRKIIN